MNLTDKYMAKKFPEVIREMEFRKELKEMAKKAMFMAYFMMIVYMGMVTYNMYLIVERHKYENIANIFINIFMFILMMFSVKILKRIR